MVYHLQFLWPHPRCDKQGCASYGVTKLQDNCPCHLIKPPVNLLHVFLQIPVFAGEIVAIQINQQIFNQTKQEKKYVYIYMEVS